MITKYTNYYKKVQKFNRTGKRNPEELFANDWSLDISSGYTETYASIYSESLGISLSYGPNKYTIFQFMDKDVFGGRLQLCQDENNKSKISINGKFDLVMTSMGLVLEDEYYEALYKIDDFIDSKRLTDSEMEVGSIYVALDGKMYIYLGFETLPNGELSTKSKIMEFSFYIYLSKLDPIFKKTKTLGTTNLIGELDEDYLNKNFSIKNMEVKLKNLKDMVLRKVS